MNSKKSQSTYAFTYEKNPQFKVTFTKKADTVGYATSDFKLISYANMDVSIIYQNSGAILFIQNFMLIILLIWIAF